MTAPPPTLPVEPVRPGDPVDDDQTDSAAAAIVLRGGIPLGSPFGIPVRASLASLFLYFVLATLTLGRNIDDSGHGRTAAYVLAALGAVLLEASVFAHEIGHCVAARRLGLRVTGLRLWIFGGLTQVETERLSPAREYAVAVVGPMVSLLLGGLCTAGGLLLHQERGSEAGLLLFWLGAVNGLLAAYNLLPGLPFDGGRVLRAAVWGATGSAGTGTRAAAVVGYVVAGLTAAVSVIVPGEDAATASASVVPGLLVAGYIAFNARQAMRSVALSERAPLVSAGRLARRALSAAADLPLAEALRRATDIGATSVIITSSDGRPHSLVSGAQVDGVPVERRPWIPVSSVARPITTGMVLDARLSGQAVLDALRRHPAGEYLVVEPAGQLLGVLAAIDVAAVLDPTLAGARR